VVVQCPAYNATGPARHYDVQYTSSSAMAERPRELDRRFQGVGHLEAAACRYVTLTLRLHSSVRTQNVNICMLSRPQ